MQGKCTHHKFAKNDDNILAVGGNTLGMNSTKPTEMIARLTTTPLPKGWPVLLVEAVRPEGSFTASFVGAKGGTPGAKTTAKPRPQGATPTGKPAAKPQPKTQSQPKTQPKPQPKPEGGDGELSNTPKLPAKPQDENPFPQRGKEPEQSAPSQKRPPQAIASTTPPTEKAPIKIDTPPAPAPVTNTVVLTLKRAGPSESFGFGLAEVREPLLIGPTHRHVPHARILQVYTGWAEKWATVISEATPGTQLEAGTRVVALESVLVDGSTVNIDLSSGNSTQHNEAIAALRRAATVVKLTVTARRPISARVPELGFIQDGKRSKRRTRIACGDTVWCRCRKCAAVAIKEQDVATDTFVIVNTASMA